MKVVTAVVDISILGGKKVVGLVLSGVSFEGAFMGNLEGLRLLEDDPLGVS